jgi:signal peptidase I
MKIMPKYFIICLFFVASNVSTAQAGDLFFIQNLKIPQNGMYPTLPAKSVFWVKKGPLFDLSKVKRGDIVVYEDISEKGRYIFVWRVMALPGDQIEISDKAIAINGINLSQIKEKEENQQIIYKEKNGNIEYLVAYDKKPKPASRVKVDLKVPSGHYFLMGDNRDNAYDSRFKGPVKGEMIFGIRM